MIKAYIQALTMDFEALVMGEDEIVNYFLGKLYEVVAELGKLGEVIEEG